MEGGPCRVPVPRAIPGHASMMRRQDPPHMREIT
jgi:hypothetical protein